MEAATLELKPLKEENGVMKETVDDRSNSPYPTTPSPLPPYSDMDHNLAESECNGFSDRHNNIDIDTNTGRETSDTNIRKTNDGLACAFTAFYAQVVFLVASILILIEVFHGKFPLLFFHGYVLTYLTGGSIFIFLCVYLRKLVTKCPQFIYRGYDHNKEKFSTPFMRNLLYSHVSIYLRIGAVVFGFGTLIYSVLEVASLFTMSSDCMDDLNFAQTFLRALFSLLQMHFLFMNTKEIIHALGWFRHVALMHLLATNLSMCVRLVFWESAKDWAYISHEKHNSSTIWPSKEFNVTVHTLESDKGSSDVTKHIPTHNVRFTTNCYWRPIEETGSTGDMITLNLCLKNSTTGAILDQAMPYLYPFTIQYSLVAAAIIYTTCSYLQSPNPKSKQMTTVSVSANDTSERQKKCIDCTKGLFFGFIQLAVGIISLILFFALSEDITEIIVFRSLRCGILVVSTLVIFSGISKIKTMKSKTKQQHPFSEVLQRIGVFAVSVFGIYTAVVGVILLTKIHHLPLFLDGMFTVVQAYFQSYFIHQVSKKRLDHSNVDEKPGRHVVVFLVFSNMALWLLETFTTQNQNSNMLQVFQATFWPVILRIIIPLVAFYRFHSAVALMEALRKTYKIKWT